MGKLKIFQHRILGNPELLDAFDLVRIWSAEWQAYWRPEGRGYTSEIDEAGIYEIEDAWKRVKHCGPEKKIVIEEVSPKSISTQTNKETYATK